MGIRLARLGACRLTRLGLTPRRAALAAGLAVGLVLGIASTAQAYVSGDQIWARTGPSHAIIYAVAAAPDGGVYAVGDTYAKSNPGKTLVIRRTASGAAKWVRTFGASDGLAVALDRRGYVYVAADVSISGGTGYELLKISPTGKLLWSRRCLGKSGVGMLGRPCLAVTPSGGVFLAGMERRGFHTIVRKYSTGGLLRWTWRSADAGPAAGLAQCGLALDSTGKAYVSASTAGTRLAVYSVDPLGHLRWRNLYAVSSMTVTSIAVRGDRVCASGSVFMLMGSANFEVVSCQLDGTLVYDVTYGDVSHPSNSAQAVALDAAGDAYLTGFSGDLTSGFGGTGGCLTMKLDPSGTVLWAQVFGGANHAWAGSALAIDASGTAYVTGLEHVGLRQTVFVASYTSMGVPGWQNKWNDAFHGSDESRCIALARATGLYIGGDFLRSDYTAALIKFMP